MTANPEKGREKTRRPALFVQYGWALKTVVGEINRNRRISITALDLNEKEQKRQRLG